MLSFFHPVNPIGPYIFLFDDITLYVHFILYIDQLFNHAELNSAKHSVGRNANEHTIDCYLVEKKNCFTLNQLLSS